MNYYKRVNGRLDQADAEHCAEAAAAHTRIEGNPLGDFEYLTLQMYARNQITWAEYMQFVSNRTGALL